MPARAPRARLSRFALALAVVAGSGAASAREVGLRWVASGSTPPAGYVAYVRAPDRPYEEGVDVGLPGVDSDGLYSVRLYDVPDEDVFLALSAYSEDGAESKLSNEIRIPARTEVSPAWNDITVRVDDGALHPILDATEGGVTELSGVRVAYGAAMDGRGRLRGRGAADLDDDGTYETPVRVKGSVRGKGGAVASKLRLLARGKVDEGKARLRTLIRRRVQSDTGSDEEEIRTRGKVFGENVSDDVSKSASIDTRTLGWSVTFRLDSAERRGPSEVVGVLRTADGRSVALSGRARARGDEPRWTVRLRSSGTDKGVRIRLDDLTVGPSFAVQGGRLRYKAFGQKGDLELPSGL